MNAVLQALVSTGGHWVIYLLFLGSILTLAVIIERAMVFVRERRAFLSLRAQALRPIAEGQWTALKDLLDHSESAAALCLRSGLTKLPSTPAAVEERLAAGRIETKYRLERRLWVLGTLGNNAPFVGLFGTVLGIIKAFGDLASATTAGPEVVMAGISEALIATAVGLLVAIPAVMFYNYFMKRTGELLADTDALSRRVLATLKDS